MEYGDSILNTTTMMTSSSSIRGGYDMLNNALSCEYMTPTLRKPVYKLYHTPLLLPRTVRRSRVNDSASATSASAAASVIYDPGVIAHLYYEIEVNNNNKKYKDNCWRWYNKSVNNCRNWLTNIPTSSSSYNNNNGRTLSNRILAIDPTSSSSSSSGGGGGGGGGGGCRLCDITINNNGGGNGDDGNGGGNITTSMKYINIDSIMKSSRKGSCITEIKSQALDDEYAFITTDTSFHITSLASRTNDDCPTVVEEQQQQQQQDDDDDDDDGGGCCRNSNKLLISESRGMDTSHVYPGKAVIVTPTSLFQYDPNKDKLINIFTIGGKGKQQQQYNHHHPQGGIGNRGVYNNNITNNITTTTRTRRRILSKDDQDYEGGIKEDNTNNENHHTPTLTPPPHTSTSTFITHDDDDDVNSGYDDDDRCRGRGRRFTGVCYSYIHPEVLFIGGIRLSMIDMRCPIYPKLRTLNNNIQPAPYYVGLLQNWDVDDIYYWTALTTFDTTLPYQIAASSRRHSSVAIMDIRGGHHCNSTTSSSSGGIPIIAEWPLPTRQDLWLSMILQDGAGLPTCTSLQYVSDNKGRGKILSFIPYQYGSSVTCVNYNNNGTFSRPTHIFHNNRRNNGLSGCTFINTNNNNNTSSSSIGVVALNWKGHLMLATTKNNQQEEEEEGREEEERVRAARYRRHNITVEADNEDYHHVDNQDDNMIKGSSSSSSYYYFDNNNGIIPPIKSKSFKPISYRERDWAPKLLLWAQTSSSSQTTAINGKKANKTSIILSNSGIGDYHINGGGDDGGEEEDYDDSHCIGKYINYDNDLIIILTALGIIYPKEDDDGGGGGHSLLLSGDRNILLWRHNLKYNKYNQILLSNILKEGGYGGKRRQRRRHEESGGGGGGGGGGCLSAIRYIINNIIKNTPSYHHWLSITHDNNNKQNNNNKCGMRYWDYLTLYRQSIINDHHQYDDDDKNEPLNRYELLSVLKVLEDDGLLRIEMYYDEDNNNNNNNKLDWIAIPIYENDEGTSEEEREKKSITMKKPNYNDDDIELEYNNSSMVLMKTTTNNDNNNGNSSSSNNNNKPPLLCKNNIDMDTIQDVINRWDNNNYDDESKENDDNKDEKRKRKYVEL